MDMARMWIGALIRLFSAVIFLIGIIVCFFSFGKGIVLIIVGIVGWNLGAKILEEKVNIEEVKDAAEREMKIEAISKEKHIDYQLIDYSVIPYDLRAGWSSSDNRFQALTDISYMNEFLKEARKIANIREKLEICTEEVKWEGREVSYIECLPHTKTGRAPKYIVKVHFATRDSSEFEPPDNYFGDIYYMQDGSIGKAWLVCWIRRTTYQVDIGLVGKTLAIKKIETCSAKAPEKRIIYKK